jgi:hypothetical protein
LYFFWLRGRLLKEPPTTEGAFVVKAGVAKPATTQEDIDISREQQCT